MLTVPRLRVGESIHSILSDDNAFASLPVNFLDCLNPDSLTVLTGCKVESALVEEAKKHDAEGEGRTAKTAPGFQFMRVGYFCMDSRDCRADHLVFNRSVLLKDSFKPGK